MHPLRHPRNAIFVGLSSLSIGVIYWAVPTSAAGTSTTPASTMLILLGVAMGIMAYVLIAGSPEDD